MMAIDEVNSLGWFATDRYQTADTVIIYIFIPNEIKKIVKSEDANFVAQTAQLKRYKKGTKPQYDNTKLIQNVLSDSKEKNSKETMALFIADNITYTNKSNFRSKEALSLFNDYQKRMRELVAKQNLLSAKRTEYGEASDTDKKEIANNIINLEIEVMELEATTQNQVKEIRNKEINFLSKNL